MEEETSLDERWDSQILAARPKADIIKWAHLQRHT